RHRGQQGHRHHPHRLRPHSLGPGRVAGLVQRHRRRDGDVLTVMRTASASWWAAPLLAMGVALPATASLDVSPIRIELSRTVPNALVTLTNTGKDLTRFELRVVSWSQNQAGEMDLQSTR